MRYQSLFETAETKSDLVATFLALLELMKARRIRVDGEGDKMEVHVQGDVDKLPTEMTSEFED